MHRQRRPVLLQAKKKRPRENQGRHDGRTRIPRARLPDEAVPRQDHPIQHQNTRNPQETRPQDRNGRVHERGQVARTPTTGDHVRIRGQKARIQNIPGWVRVRGVGQLEGWEQAKAVLTSEADGWHLHVTCYMDKEEHRKRREAKRLAPVKNTIIGLDMGVKTAITCSDGTEYDVMVEETDRLKREQRKLNRKKKGSNNRQRNRMRIRRAYTKQQNRLNDAANKTAAELLRNETIFMQDEQVKAWHRRYGRKIQHSILGRVKNRLTRHAGQVVVLSKWEPTTQLCPVCGTKTRIPLERRIYKCATVDIRPQETSKPLRPWSGWDNPNIRTKYPWNEGNTSLWRTHRSHTWTICVCSPCVGEAGNRDGFSLTVVHRRCTVGSNRSRSTGGTRSRPFVRHVRHRV